MSESDSVSDSMSVSESESESDSMSVSESESMSVSESESERPVRDRRNTSLAFCVTALAFSTRANLCPASQAQDMWKDVLQSFSAHRTYITQIDRR